MKQERKVRNQHRRYILSLALFVATLSGLFVAGLDGAAEQVNAQEAPRSYWSQVYRDFRTSNERQNNQSNRTTNSNGNANRTQNEQKNTETKPADTAKNSETTKETSPVTPAQQTTTTPAAPQATPAPVPVVTPQITPQSAAAVPVNTAPEIAATTSAQADTQSKAVTYTTQQISAETRDRLLAMAAVAALSGTIIFIMSMFGSGSASATTLSPVRVRVPVREAINS